MDKERKELSIAFWHQQGLELLERWKHDPTNKTLWGAFCCCAAAIVEVDRKHKDKRTQELQSLDWRYAWAKGETSLERWQNSGYFDEAFYNKVMAERG